MITCPDSQGNLYETGEFKYTESTNGLDFWMQLYIPHLQFKMQVRNLWEYSYRENGVAFAVIFDGVHEDVPECTISSGVNDPMTGNDVVFSTETIREYGQNLMFEPIPLSMLFTDA